MKLKAQLLSSNVFKALFLLTVFTVSALSPHMAHADWLDSILGGYDTVRNTVGGFLNTVNNVVGGVLNTVGSVFDELGLGWLWNDFMNWLFGSGTCGQVVQGGVGQVLCNVVISTEMLPGLITAIAYMAGLILSVVAIIKLKAHVDNPNQTPLSDSMKRFVAGGALFALPVVTSAVKNLLVGGENGEIPAYSQSGGFSGTVSASGGLDSMIIYLVADLWQPLQILLGAFAYLAGLVFVVIGIGRLIKTAQEGPSGPTGIGTIMTFITAGVLFSLDSIMGAFSTSMFATSDVATYAILSDTTGDMMVDSHVKAVISSIVAFMALVGWISFIRGFFILRDVAEGKGQASLMAATTHMFGGALAVNLGPLMNAVQSTFGLTQFGVIFTT